MVAYWEIAAHSAYDMRPSQGFWGFWEKGYLFSGIWGEGSFIFRDFGEKAYLFGGLGSREQGAEEKHFRELGRKVIFLSGSREQRPPPPGGHPICSLVNIPKCPISFCHLGFWIWNFFLIAAFPDHCLFSPFYQLKKTLLCLRHT